MGKDVCSHTDSIEVLSQSLSRLKEEVIGQDGATVKHEVGPASSELND